MLFNKINNIKLIKMLFNKILNNKLNNKNIIKRK